MATPRSRIARSFLGGCGLCHRLCEMDLSPAVHRAVVAVHSLPLQLCNSNKYASDETRGESWPGLLAQEAVQPTRFVLLLWPGSEQSSEQCSEQRNSHSLASCSRRAFAVTAKPGEHFAFHRSCAPRLNLVNPGTSRSRQCPLSTLCALLIHHHRLPCNPMYRSH